MLSAYNVSFLSLIWYIPHLWDTMSDCITSYFPFDHQYHTDEANRLPWFCM